MERKIVLKQDIHYIKMQIYFQLNIHMEMMQHVQVVK